MFETEPSFANPADNDSEKGSITENAETAKKEKDPELAREIDLCRNNVLTLLESLGIENAAELLPSSAEICVSETDDFFPDAAASADDAYKIRIRKELPLQSRLIYERLGMDDRIDELSKDGRMRELTYKLISNACRGNRPAGKSEENGAEEFPGSEQDKFVSFDNALTELTTHQLFLKDGKTPDHISNPYQVIFLSVLVEDITERLNGGDPLTSSNPSLPDSIKERIKARMAISFEDPKREEAKFKEEDILAYFQKGAFLSDRKCLEMIGTIYGEKALSALSDMGEDELGIIETARTFKPRYNPNEIGNKTSTLIDYFLSNLPTRIKIADQEAHISIVNLL
jgi:hypothetical protein